jgi:hypothetical protein
MTEEQLVERSDKLSKELRACILTHVGQENLVGDNFNVFSETASVTVDALLDVMSVMTGMILIRILEQNKQYDADEEFKNLQIMLHEGLSEALSIVPERLSRGLDSFKKSQYN